MSVIRRMGVNAEYGSLAAYRSYVIEGRRESLNRLHTWVPMADDEKPASRADLRAQIADWTSDLEWVDAQIAGDAVAA